MVHDLGVFERLALDAIHDRKIDSLLSMQGGARHQIRTASSVLRFIKG